MFARTSLSNLLVLKYKPLYEAYSGTLSRLTSFKVALSPLKSPWVALSSLKSILITQCYNGSLVLNCTHKEDIMQDNR